MAALTSPAQVFTGKYAPYTIGAAILFIGYAVFKPSRGATNPSTVLLPPQQDPAVVITSINSATEREANRLSYFNDLVLGRDALSNELALGKDGFSLEGARIAAGERADIRYNVTAQELANTNANVSITLGQQQVGLDRYLGREQSRRQLYQHAATAGEKILDIFSFF